MTTKDKWFKDNNLSDNQMYAEKILEKFKLYKYHFVYDAYGNLSLLIENNLKKYKININRKKHLMEIYRCEVHIQFKKYTKEYVRKAHSFRCGMDSTKYRDNVYVDIENIHKNLSNIGI